MFKLLVKRVIASLMIVNVMGLGLVPAAQAGVIGTQTWLQMEQREARLARVNSVVLEQEVQQELLARGVDADEVQARIAALTDEELLTLESELDKLPAGGDALAVIGAVFLVLIILELVGVINVFKGV
ncbi:MAG: PA2779 family protein [Pseudomonadota bacterium]|nr:PA2779 family protein [Pseudomonadota bacterium]